MNNQQPPDLPKQKLGCLPYAIGGASFIPLLGIPLALTAIIWGLITRKAGRLALILLGIGGILFSGILYGGLFYFGFVQRGGLYDKLREQLAHAGLQSLTKEVEFYRLQAGRYPSRLEELIPKTTNSMVSICDPSQIQLTGTNAMTYYYELQADGQHYYLLSVGSDRLPFTKDDLIPQFTDSEMVRMGLLIKKE